METFSKGIPQAQLGCMFVRNPGQLDISGVFRGHGGHVVRSFSKTTRMGLAIEAEFFDLLKLQTCCASITLYLEDIGKQIHGWANL